MNIRVVQSFWGRLMCEQLRMPRPTICVYTRMSVGGFKIWIARNSLKSNPSDNLESSSSTPIYSPLVLSTPA